MIKVCSIVLYDDEKKILFQLRDNKPDICNPNAWGFFGGHVEEGENFEEALVREIKEEIDYDLERFEFFREYLESESGEDKEARLYISKIRSEEDKFGLKLLEGSGFAWLSIENAKKLNFGIFEKRYLKTLDEIEKYFEKL